MAAKERIDFRTVAFEKIKRIFTPKGPVVTVIIDDAASAIPSGHR